MGAIFAFFMGIIYTCILCFVLWLAMRAVNAMEQLAASQQRMANTLADIAWKNDGRNNSENAQQ
jgi:hypothetical protein